MTIWHKYPAEAPPVGVPLLVVHDGGGGKRTCIVAEYHDGSPWLDAWGGYGIGSVSHWMPLPELPRIIDPDKPRVPKGRC